MLLFGTSANPPTGFGGHAGIIRWAAEREDVDQIWVLPVYRHAFEEKREMPSFPHRMEMARLAFLPISPKVKVLDVEKRVSSEMGDDALVGTVDVVRHLMREHPDIELGLLLGADTYRDLMAGRWKESEALRRMVRIVPVSRRGVDESIGGIGAIDGPVLDEVSSTECRRTGDARELTRVLQPKVLEYIRANRLYAFSERD